MEVRTLKEATGTRTMYLVDKWHDHTITGSTTKLGFILPDGGAAIYAYNLLLNQSDTQTAISFSTNQTNVTIEILDTVYPVY